MHVQMRSDSERYSKSPMVREREVDGDDEAVVMVYRREEKRENKTCLGDEIKKEGVTVWELRFME